MTAKSFQNIRNIITLIFIPSPGCSVNLTPTSGLNDLQLDTARAIRALCSSSFFCNRPCWRSSFAHSSLDLAEYKECSWRGLTYYWNSKAQTCIWHEPLSIVRTMILLAQDPLVCSPTLFLHFLLLVSFLLLRFQRIAITQRNCNKLRNALTFFSQSLHFFL